MSKGAIVFPLMQLNVNTYANSVIENLFTLTKFMEVLMNVYLRYSLYMIEFVYDCILYFVYDCIFCVNEQQKV